MRKSFLKKARETLQEMRTQLLRSVQAELHEGREQTKDEGMDTYDLASDARDREINFILSDRDREKVQAIDDALARVVRPTSPRVVSRPCPSPASASAVRRSGRRRQRP